MQDFQIRNEQDLINLQTDNQQIEQLHSSTNQQKSLDFFQHMNNIQRKKQIQLQKNKNYQRINMKKYESPHLPNKECDRKYTLVLDIDETLAHSQFTGEDFKVSVRPYVQDFLQKLSIFYEIVTFTAGTKEYADQVIDEHLDPQQKWISHRLYRNNCKWYIDKTMNNEKFCIKDISKINRDINTVLIIDNIADNYSILSPFNGIQIFAYEGIFDSVLLNLIPILTYVAQKMIDIRSFVYSCVLGLQFKNLSSIVNKITQEINGSSYNDLQISFQQNNINDQFNLLFQTISIFLLFIFNKSLGLTNQLLAYFGFEILVNSNETKGIKCLKNNLNDNNKIKKTD